MRRRRADLVPRRRTRPGCAARWPGTSRSPTTWASCPARARSPPTGRWSAPGWRCCPPAPAPTGPAEVEPLSAAERTDLVRRLPGRAGGRPLRAGRRRRRGAGLAALLPEPAAGPLGELPGRRPDAVEPRRWPGSSCSTGCTGGPCWTWTTRPCCPGCCGPGPRYAARQRGLPEAAARADRRGDRGDGAGVRPPLLDRRAAQPGHRGRGPADGRRGGPGRPGRAGRLDRGEPAPPRRRRRLPPGCGSAVAQPAAGRKTTPAIRAPSAPPASTCGTVWSRSRTRDQPTRPSSGARPAAADRRSAPG